MRMIFLLPTLIFMAGCTSGQNKQENRIDAVFKTLDMMERFDSSGLMSIIDTSYCYDIYGHEGFQGILKYVNRNVRNCAKPVKENFKTDYNRALNFTEIFVPFRCKVGDSLSHQFNLVFRFFDHESSGKIGFIDVIKNSHFLKPKTTTALPGI